VAVFLKHLELGCMHVHMRLALKSSGAFGWVTVSHSCVKL
jgi:hypothetical protein